MIPSRLPWCAALVFACVSCKSAPDPQNNDLHLPPPPPPVLPGRLERMPPPRVEQSQEEAPATWHPRNSGPKEVAPTHEAEHPADVRPASAHVPRDPSTLAAIADALETRLAANPADSRTRRQLLYVYLAMGDEASFAKADDELQACPPTTFEDRLIAASIHYRIGGPENMRTLRLLRDAQEELYEILPFQVRTACFCQKNVPKPGQFHKLTRAEFVPGESVCLYLSFDNFGIESDGQGQQRVSLAFDYRILDLDGREIPWKESESYRRDFSETYQERVRDLCVPLVLTWPRDIGANNYVLEVTVTDRTGSGRKSATQRLDFRIK